MLKKISVFVLFTALLAGTAWPGQGLHRFAFIVGANNGGQGRVILRYAVSDAQSIYQVMREMGGLSSSDTVFLTDPSSSDFWQGMGEIKARLQAAKNKNQHIEVMVYYSGHADEKGLLLGGETISFQDFRKAVDGLPADVRIAILDSCSSGQVTRSKGGKMLPPFMLDSSSTMKGYAFLTSSSEDEASQESDTIEGSFFTHYLVSGLRGGADRNQDGKVTLHETYQFAFDETLARTEQTLSGPQHPGYDIQMKGSGDVVLTDVRNNTAILLLDTELWGRFFIRNSQGKLVAELNKAPGKPTELGLAPGEYTITLDKQNQLFTARVKLIDSRQVILFPWQLQKIQGELSVKRGDNEIITNSVLITNQNEAGPVSATNDGTLLIITPKHNIQIKLPTKDLGKKIEKQIKDRLDEHFSLSFSSDKATHLSGFSFSLGYKGVSQEMQGTMFSLGVNRVGQKASGAMISLGLNLVDQDMQGVQFTLGNNQVGDSMRGLQLSLGINIAGKHMQGIQLSTGANISTLNLQGIQMAVGYNYTGSTMIGIQSAVGVNITKGNMIGAQLSAGVNIVDTFANGLQLGMVNIAHDQLLGGQVGLVNIGKKIQGVQIGLINIADDVSGLPLGLINIIRNGNNRWHLWSDETGAQNLGFSMGSKYMYSIYNVAIPLTNTHLNLGLGLGLHFPGKKNLYVEVEAMAEYILPLDGSFKWWWEPGAINRMMYIGRVSLGIKLGKHFSIAGGLSYNIYQPNGATDDYNIHPVHEVEAAWVNDNIRSWPGMFLALYFYH